MDGRAAVGGPVGGPVGGFGGVDGIDGARSAPSADPAGASGQFGGSGSHGEGGNAAALPAILGGSDVPPYARLLSTVVTSSGAVTLAMAFMFFGKRRRDGTPPAPDEVLEAAAARGIGEGATSALVPDAQQPNRPVDLEAGMPRWRRPSLLAARKADPIRSPQEARSLTFDHGLMGPVEGLERRRIRYRVVRLLDSPDEVRASEVGILDEGDEVQLLERSGAYWLVVTPDDRQGWLHKMVLGEIVEEASGNADRDADASAGAGPQDEEDALAAYLAARARERR